MNVIKNSNGHSKQCTKAHGQLHQKETKKSANEALVIDLCIKDMESSHSGFIDRLQGPERGTTMCEGMSLKT